MTPQERQRVTELFDRLAQLETAPRDAEAERAMADGLARAPHAIYPLVQTVLVQDEALRRADARIRELSGQAEAAPESGGFLDSMRSVLMGGAKPTSVPAVRPATGPDPRWNTGGAAAQPAAPQAAAPSPGGSFLGTAAASAAGVIGGALLFNSISSMLSHHSGSAFAGEAPAASPWSDSSNSDLASDAGLNDIGNDRSSGLFDSGDADVADLGGDIGGGDFGGGGDSA